jgi:xylulokinase
MESVARTVAIIADDKVIFVWSLRHGNNAMILVVDLGTSYFKLALVDHCGQLVELSRIEPPIRRDPPGTMELDAEAFVGVLEEGIARLGARAPGMLAKVRAVTFATQTNSFVVLDAADRPLTPIILWPDERAADFEEELRSLCDLPEFTLTTGIPAVNRQVMAAKLLWIQRKLPQTWKRAAKICLISDYLTLLLTGRHVTEAGAAGLTGLLDIHRCCWWPEVLAQLGIPQALLPQVVRAGSDLGPIARSDTKLSRLGLSSDCRFIVGCLDQYAGAIGAGSVTIGSLSETTGTVLATVRCTDRFDPVPSSGMFQGPAFTKGVYYQMAFGETSANYLEWYRKQLPDRMDFDQLVALASHVKPGADGLRLRTDVAVTGEDAAISPNEVFEGVTPAHTTGHMVRCIMEAVAHALREQVTVLADDTAPSGIRSVGGGARSDLWLQIKADILGIPVRATECSEPTCLGAAILAEASLAASDVRDIAQRWVRLKPPFLPNQNVAGVG